MTAVEYIEKGILARERHWHDQYQQGYQRALSDVMLLVDEAKQMEKNELKKFFNAGFVVQEWDKRKVDLAEQHYNETYKK